VRKILSAFNVALSMLCVLSLFGLPAHGQDRDRDRDGDRDNEKGETTAPANGIVQDWSGRHALYPRFGPLQGLIDAQRDPRAILSWQEQSRKDWRRFYARRHPRVATTAMHRDWSISLGLGTTAAGMFPAKFGFDPSAAPTCADFAVFPVNATGSATQPNIVAFKNLYSGGSKAITGNTNSTTTVTITAGTVTAADVGQPISGTGIPGGDTIATVIGGPPATSLTLAVAATATNVGVAITVGSGAAGFCNGRAPVATADNPLQATTLWSYDINGAGGKVVTSPALSIDGTKVAFVETAAGAAHFHVLAWKSGDGLNAANGQNVLTPKVLIAPFSAVAPAGGTGTVTDLTLAAASDTLSSPFVEYNQDVAYVGNDTGTLFRIKNVFCTMSCTPGTSAAPSLDLSWPTSGGSANTGTLSVCAAALTGPIVGPGGNVYVGCADGKLYGITPTGTIFGPVTVGNGGVDGGIVDPPLADVVNGFVYAVSGNNGTTSVLVQAPTNLSSSVTATLGSAGKFNLHSPTFNEDYFSCAPQAAGCTWRIFALALDATNTHSSLWAVGFAGLHVMNGGAGTVQAFGINPFEFSPATTFFDGVQDRLFESVLTNSIGGNLVSFNVSNGTTSPFALESSATEGAGTSGIIVDNNGTGTVQADSVYFGTLTTNTAVKLTQSGLL
jgi:hypothetical protein